MPAVAFSRKETCTMTKVDDFTQRVRLYHQSCVAANRSPDIKVLEHIVTDLFTIDEQRTLGSSARIILDALNQTRDGT